jgi:hypothetical protein
MTLLAMAESMNCRDKIQAIGQTRSALIGSCRQSNICGLNAHACC